MARNVAFSGFFSGVDHERIGSNEEITRPVQQAIVLTNANVPMSFFPIDFGWGGECRATFLISASIVENSAVSVLVNGKFYEGDNEAADPNQLEQELSIPILIPKGKVLPFKMQLYNDGAFGGGGDSATLELSFSNNLVEDEEDEVTPVNLPPVVIMHRPFRHIPDMVINR